MGAVKSILGIDYGSKMAGTTVLAFVKEAVLHLQCSEKKKDADQMILSLYEVLKPELVAIDAPLSLPGVYREMPGHSDYFYRACDRDTKAMSPMFLGGLTARAMKLSVGLGTFGADVIEAYPVKAGKLMGLEKYGYRSKSPDLEGMLEHLLVANDWKMADTSERITAHHIDAVLALMIGHRHQAGEASVIGDADEGLIYY